MIVFDSFIEWNTLEGFKETSVVIVIGAREKEIGEVKFFWKFHFQCGNIFEFLNRRIDHK